MGKKVAKDKPGLSFAMKWQYGTIVQQLAYVCQRVDTGYFYVRINTVHDKLTVFI